MKGPVSPSIPVGRGANCNDAQRMVLAGGDLVARLKHPDFITFERTFRKVPPSSFFFAAASRPQQIELGAAQSSQQSAILVTNYSFRVYVQQGSSTVAAEPGALAQSLGFDINVAQTTRSGEIEYQQVATPAQLAQQAAYVSNPSFGMSPQPGPQNVLPVGVGVSAPTFSAINPTLANRIRGQLSANAAGAATLPNKPTRAGDPEMPFVLLATNGDLVQASASSFGPIPLPVAFLECSVQGFQVPTQLLASLMRGAAPCW